jgi:hypothetical protein
VVKEVVNANTHGTPGIFPISRQHQDRIYPAVSSSLSDPQFKPVERHSVPPWPN